MAAGKRDGERDPENPDNSSPSMIWPEGQDMVSQQEAANELFQKNSARLNALRVEDAERVEVDPSPSAPDPGTYSGLKQEHAEETYREVAEPERDTSGIDPVKQEHTDQNGIDELTFAKDIRQPNRAGLKEEHANALDVETPANTSQLDRDDDERLTFVKDKERDTEREIPSEPGDTLHFAKDRGQRLGLDR